MLVDFQTALADMTASPALCREVRRKPATLRDGYDLTEKEWRRLVSIESSKGMQANCMLYRANRLAPVALDLPETCDLIRDDLNQVVSAYWESEPTTDVNFLVEAERSCRFVEAQQWLAPEARCALMREHSVLVAKLAASRNLAAPWT